MPHYPLRPVTLPERTQSLYDRWLNDLDQALEAGPEHWSSVAREVIQTLHPEAAGGSEILAAQLDPEKITLEAEYYHEVDDPQFLRVKPLLWLWEMFDRSPAGENLALGIPFRRLLARRIFRRCGQNFKCFPHVHFTFGYNMEVGDNVVVHRHVMLDDRGGIRLGNGVSLSDYVNVYSHTHDVDDPSMVEAPVTLIGDGVRVTYHATVLAGVHVADNALVGAMALATRDAEGSTVHLGIPARPFKPKPGKPRAPRRPDPLADG
jgi:acetyltransferase-like isoleucine patch superfamily enzyme